MNSGENIALVYKPTGQATTTIDEIPYDFNWYAGSSNYYSMERYDPAIVGTDASNWGTNNSTIRNGKNAGGEASTARPKRETAPTISSTKGKPFLPISLLFASRSPYLVDYSIQTFNASPTLTIEPGVVINLIITPVCLLATARRFWPKERPPTR